MKTVLISVAHSSKAPGAQNHDCAASEYLISQRASLACYRALSGAVPVELFDAGPLTPSEYDDAKTECVNACMPALAVEIHLNSSENAKAKYGEVLHHRNSPMGKDAGEAVMHSLAMLFSTQGPAWIARGARANISAALCDTPEAKAAAPDKELFFFLEKTRTPAIIVEGLFISNPLHARWLVGEGGQDLYGVAVANGIKDWLGVKP